MSEPNYYEKLGLDENSSFEEIQDARNRLLEEHSGDRKQQETIEAAYDAILMDRLRLRQEGKIKVPDRIRFPERLAEPPPDINTAPSQQAPEWLQRFIDTPSREEILWPAVSFVAIGLLSLVDSSYAALSLAIAAGFSLYFLNRKERKFARAFLLTLIGLVVGVFLGLQLGNLMQSQLEAVSLAPDSFAVLVTAFLLWLISSFLR
ncbi:MAG TPA: CPP1-like family protein [Elainellaceae cyanobacterium]